MWRAWLHTASLYRMVYSDGAQDTLKPQRIGVPAILHIAEAYDHKSTLHRRHTAHPTKYKIYSITRISSLRLSVVTAAKHIESKSMLNVFALT